MSNRRCTILFFTQTDWFFHLHFLPLAVELVERGADVALACLVDEHRERIEAAGVHVLPLSQLRVRNLGPLRQLRGVIELARLFRRERPGLVHLISPKPVVLGSIAARIAGVPSVLSLITGLGYLFTHAGPVTRFVRRVSLAAIRWSHTPRARRIVFQNNDDRTLFTDLQVIREEKAALIPGVGTDLDRFKPGERDNDPPVIVFGARMLRDKGVVELVEAARTLQAERIACRVLLCGKPDPGNPTSISQGQLRRWHDQGIVEWHGHVEDIAPVLASADIACLPSYREGMPKFLLDAAASGLPLVATNVPGCRDLIHAGINGTLVPARNSAALAEALGELIVDRERRHRYGAASRRIAERELAQELAIRRTIDLYRLLLREAGIDPCSIPLAAR
ncbi:MAG: N,N'-diacetylbacillosaminyl-diphospho-undecaprenol alpha-1,3-N-acetylgalactosaminyltransferase [Calditrichaeota bacterium]|nr:N,N'-diacetylbacillosaminyl-diphospho-undecaprenol alpha-1,3-N-acetylgalactosaminyltransferase [Calditrichota bacterium]